MPTVGSLALQLAKQWASYVSFAMSFAFIGIMWINHHRLFTHIRRCDNGLLLLNLLLLLGVTFLPYPTAVLGMYLGRTDQRLAAIFFNATCFCIAIFFNLLWRYATSPKRHLLAHDVDAAAIQRITRQFAFGPLPYLGCLALAWVNVKASLGLNILLACFFALPPDFKNRHEAVHEEERRGL
jgi:uncharacterized membrane protein